MDSSELSPSQLFEQNKNDLVGLFNEEKKAPEQIAHYKILSELGVGGMGKVYKAHDPQMNRTVAIKVILHPSAKARNRFIAEAKIMAQFRHPNIVTVYDVAANVVSSDYIVMDFIEGKDLTSAKSSPRETLKIIRDAALALDYAHQQGIIHRDLKPANLMLETKTNKVVVMDFGLAKNTKSADITQSGALMGTPRYMAPEQAVSKLKLICPQTDVYALGAILYELLTGVPAIEGKTPAQVIYNILQNDIVPLQKRKPQLAVEMGIICAKAMAKEINQRYSNAKNFADDIDSFLQGEIIRAQAFPLWYRAGKKIKKHRMVVAALITFLLILAGSVRVFRAKQNEKAIENLNNAKKIFTDLPKEVMSINTLKDAKKFAYDRRIDPILEKHIKVLEPLRKAHGYGKANKLLLQSYKRIGLLALTKKNYILSQSVFGLYQKLKGQEDLQQILLEEENKDVNRVKFIMAKAKNHKPPKEGQDYQLDTWVVEISRRKHSKVVRSLLPFVESGNWWQRMLAYRALGKLGDKTTKLGGKDSGDLLIVQLKGLEPVKEIDINNETQKINEEIKELIWALGWLKDKRANKLIYSIRFQVQDSLLENKTKIPFRWIPIGSDSISGYMEFTTRGGMKREKEDYVGAIADYSMAIKLNSQHAKAYNGRGIAHKSQNNIQGAIADYSMAIKLNPNYFQAYNNRGNIRELQEDYRGAIEDCTCAIKINPHYFGAYNNRGLARASLGDYQEAIADYSMAIKLNPRYAAGYNNRANACNAQKDYKGAIADYSMAIKLNPLLFEAYYNRAGIHRDQKNYQEAIADYTMAIKLNPRFFLAYLNRGNTYNKKKNYKKAIEDYIQAIKINPKHKLSYYNRGIVYNKQKKYAKAIADYSIVIKLAPQYSKAYISRGISYAEQRDHQRAIADFSMTIKLNPQNSKAYNNLGLVYKVQRIYQKAIANFSMAIKLNSKYSEAYNNRAITCHMQKNYKQAIEDYSAAIELNPRFSKAYNNRAITYRAQKNYQRAIADYSMAIKINPQYFKAYNSRGIIRKAQKDYQGAIEDYSMAIELNPKFLEAYNNRGNIYKVQKDYKGAIADYSMAIKINPRSKVYYNRGIAYLKIKKYTKAYQDFQVFLKFYPNTSITPQVHSMILNLRKNKLIKMSK